jgi:membrane associated rhomboid family serine protease
LSEEEAPEDELATPRPWVTWALLGVNLVIYVLMFGDGANPLFPNSLDSLREWGAVDARLVWEGEGWRLFTGMFVHAAVWHVGMNMWVLLQVGGLLERSMGAARYLLLYLVTGVAGFAVSVLLQGGVTCGASGAIFGVVGGLFGLAIVTDQRIVRERLLSSLSLFVAATLAIGLAVPIIDNSAHIGGLLAGILLSYGLLADNKGERLERLERAGVVDEETASKMRPRFALASLIFAALLFAAVLLLSLKPVFSPRFHVVKAVSALATGDDAEALEHVKRAEGLAPDDAPVLLLRARLYDGDEPERALAFLRFAFERLDTDPEDAQLTAALELGSADGLTLEDGRLQIMLCEGAVDAAGEQLTPRLRNNCAWLLLTADDHSARDPARALAWSEKAVAQAKRVGIDGAELATYLHTLAEARAQTGDPQEAVHIMERVFAEELTSDSFFRDELDRFRRLARPAPPPAPVPAPPRDAGPPSDAGVAGADAG